MSFKKEKDAPFSREEEGELIEEAQAGCQRSLNRLLAAYERPIGELIARHGRGRLSEGEAQQAGREGLWEAILSYDVQSPDRFWSVREGMGQVFCAIMGRAKQVEWQERRASWHLRSWSDEGVQAELAQREQVTAVQEALWEMMAALPERLQQVLVAYYGLAGGRPATYRQIGPQMGYSHSRIWQLHQEALARLSHPSLSYPLRQLLGRHTLADYLAAQRRVQRWLRRRGGRRQEVADAQPI
jgi:RNA polymerase sigma factor (sigma-70 family)